MNEQETVFATLRRFARPRAAIKRCELCSVGLAAEHRHMLEMATVRIVCTLVSCALRFQFVLDGRFKLIPRGVNFADFEWESLALPINLAFFFQSSPGNQIKALYPSPAGATESLLPL